jgi:peptidoglycan DL-endopeptidase CwlO
MSVGSIGSTPSFFQQDQDYWNKAQGEDAVTSANDALINVMGQAETNLAKGMASIANSTALKRVNSQITSLVEQALNPSGSTASSSSSGSPTSSGPSSNTPAAPASGTGTTPVTTSTSLATLGILPGGTITIGTGDNTTTYTSTGTDTIADLINAINIDLPTNANVTASLSAKGQLVITSRDVTSAIFIGGSGTDPAAIGFAVGNNAFLPKPASTSAASSTSSNSSTNSSSSGTSGTSASASSGAAKISKSYATAALENASSAASVLSAAGVGGTLVDMLA